MGYKIDLGFLLKKINKYELALLESHIEELENDWKFKHNKICKTKDIIPYSNKKFLYASNIINKKMKDYENIL